MHYFRIEVSDRILISRLHELIDESSTVGSPLIRQYTHNIFSSANYSLSKKFWDMHSKRKRTFEKIISRSNSILYKPSPLTLIYSRMHCSIENTRFLHTSGFTDKYLFNAFMNDICLDFIISSIIDYNCLIGL